MTAPPIQPSLCDVFPDIQSAQSTPSFASTFPEIPTLTLQVKTDGHDHPHRLLKSAPPQECPPALCHEMLPRFERMDTDDYDTCMTGIGDLSCDNLPESGGDMGGGNNISGRLVLTDLPEEVQQIVLDMLAGNLRSTSSTATDHYGTRNWSNALRHPRAKELSNLTLVTPAWRRMIQERLYRHVKVKGTKQGLEECADWFLLHQHLQAYVRHIEFWIPVWEPRGLQSSYRSITGIPYVATSQNDMEWAMPHTPPRAGLHQQMEPINSVYQLSQQNSTLDELFNCVSCLFQSACVMTIEGGHCKKPPMIRHFRDKHMRTFTTLPNIRTLIMRGAWNVIRSQPDFSGMAVALPNLREWHCTYSKPKAKAYMTVYSVLNYFPSTITHLNICLEGFYSKKVIATTKVQDLTKDHHLCEALGRIMPQLEALTLTGRLCGQLFAAAAESARHVRKPRLKSVDLVVKNCCRSAFGPTDSPGIHNWVFIQAFESLVTSATRTLSFFPDLSFLRIRFIDLDAPCPLLNPYFQLQGDECTGLWNDHILNFLALARPRAGFVDIGDGVAGRAVSKTFFNYPTQRPKGIKSTSYMAFADSNHF